MIPITRHPNGPPARRIPPNLQDGLILPQEWAGTPRGEEFTRGEAQFPYCPVLKAAPNFSVPGIGSSANTSVDAILGKIDQKKIAEVGGKVGEKLSQAAGALGDTLTDVAKGDLKKVGATVEDLASNIGKTWKKLWG